MARFRKALTAGALGAATFALIAAASSTTGAYFTDSHGGTINASTGVVKVNAGDLTLNFADTLPGVFQTKDVTYTAAGTSAEDIWLVLPTDGSAVAFTGGSGSAALGRYGHFALTSPAGSFTSYNLTSGASPCPVSANGHGGSDAQSAVLTDPPPPYCPVPNAILLSSNLTSGQTGTAKVTFGFTKFLKGGQGSTLGLVAPFKIVATQHGILPSDPNN